MKQLTNYFLIVLISQLFFSAQSMAQSKWVPVMMNDIVILVPYIAKNNPEPPVKPIQTVQDTYNPNETVSVNIQMALSGDEDWVGIFHKNDDSSWGNVLAWNWVTGNGVVSLTRDQDPLPAGEYEVRLFFHNKYGADAVVRAAYSFTVSGGGNNNYEYGSEGQYLDKVRTRETNKTIIYYPEGHVQNAPLVLVVGYMDTTMYNGDKHRLEGIMTHLASLGCYVIGHKHITGGSSWSNTIDTVKRREYFIDAVNEANNLGVDTSRLAVVGKSLGGMHAYALMKYFKSQEYGGEKSFILDLMGWYALDMNKGDLEELDIDALILHYGGKTGVQYNVENGEEEYSQDPRTLITISKILKENNNNVGFITLDTTNHSYEGGTYNDLKGKPKLLKPIDAMFRYEFFNSDGKYNDARDILFNSYDTTVQQSNDATINYIGQGTSRDKYGDLECSLRNGIDYCNDHGLE